MRHLLSRFSWPALGLGLALFGCGVDRVVEPEPEPQAPIPAALVVVSGDHQEGLASDRLVDPLVVRVVDASGNGVPGVLVTWELTPNHGLMCPTVQAFCWSDRGHTVTDGLGLSRAWLWPNRGLASVSATVANLPGSPVSFAVTVTGVVIPFWPRTECGGLNDPVRFWDPDAPQVFTVQLGLTVVWQYGDAEFMPLQCEARVVSTSAPGEQGFDSGILHPGDRFSFVPAVAGTWTYQDTYTGGSATLVVVPSSLAR